MLESFLYHTLISLFFIVLVFLYYKKTLRFNDYEQCLLPFFCQKTFELPKDRSLFVRGLTKLKLHLSLKYNCDVMIEEESSEKNLVSNDFYIFGAILAGYTKNIVIIYKNEKVTYDHLERKHLSQRHYRKIIFRRHTCENEQLWEALIIFNDI